MTDKLANMAMFVRVVENGSFAAVAKDAGVSATMVAKHVSSIEQRLGARLLHRTTRRHNLTEIGRLFYERCKQVLAEVELAEASASELLASPRGRLRLVAPVSFGSEGMVPVLTEFLDRYTEVSVDLTLDNRTPDLIGDGYELGIHIGEVDVPDLIARPLRPYRRILAAAPGYLAQHGRPASPIELCDHACLGLSYWRHQGRWHLVGPNGELAEVPVSCRFTANHGGALRMAALHGIGVVLQPEMLLADDIAAGRLEAVLPEWSYKPTPMFLIYAQHRRPTVKLRCAIDLLLSRFGP